MGVLPRDAEGVPSGSGVWVPPLSRAVRRRSCASLLPGRPEAPDLGQSSPVLASFPRLQSSLPPGTPGLSPGGRSAASPSLCPAALPPQPGSHYREAIAAQPSQHLRPCGPGLGRRSETWFSQWQRCETCVSPPPTNILFPANPLHECQGCKSFLFSLGLGQSLIMYDLSRALEGHDNSNKYRAWIPPPPNRFSIKDT